MDVRPLEDDGMQTKLAEMRTSLLAQGVSMQGIDDPMLLRFLRARAMHVPRAAKMLAEHQTWRASFVPSGFISESQIESELAQGKAFLQGVCKKTGHPLLFMIARHHYRSTDFQEFKSKMYAFHEAAHVIGICTPCIYDIFLLILPVELGFVVYAADKTIASAQAGAEKYVTIVDLEGIGYKNMDIKSLFSSLHLLQNYYPERMARLYFVKVPSIFTSFWKMVSPFIDKVTREKARGGRLL
ncbi:hypothetical protein GOP47_0008698 [Adiantum capillus-veneris]|uniref:CRAL-TRIO domain-containing protein n=1 Tax=Adiantum capillus-veneris TaxID=13818 RepID=A0A9D4UZ29_ADICA|nr:hypothetical protein GOP47_0008698 [Adiantum capillus-veneris]